MLRYKHINTHFFTITLIAKPSRKSRRGYQYIQLFVLDKGFVYSVLMKERKEFSLALKEFAREIGVPTKTKLILDPIGEHGSGDVRKFAKEYSMAIHLLEESTQWANLAEKYIGILKAAVLKDLHDSSCPMKLWYYVVKYRTAVHNVTACNTFKLGGVNPFMVTHGQDADISNLCCFKFYKWAYYWDQHENFPEQKGRLGRALGSTKFQDNEMTQYILKENGQVVPCRTVKRIPPEVQNTEKMKELMKRFDAKIYDKLGDSMTARDLKPEDLKWTPYEDNDKIPHLFPEDQDIPFEFFNASLTDGLINFEVLLCQRENLDGSVGSKVKAKVIEHLTD